MKLRPLRRALLDADWKLGVLIDQTHSDAHYADEHRADPQDTSEVDRLNEVLHELLTIRNHVRDGLTELPHMERFNEMNTIFWQGREHVAYQILEVASPGGCYMLRELHGSDLPDHPEFSVDIATFTGKGAAERFAAWLDRMGGFEDEDAERPEEPTPETIGVYDSIEASKGKKKGADDE
jgi:hypothetical protein